jgi:fatty-acyl-CoA synthase
VDLSRWKVIIGGSALPVALARATVERGVDVIAGYGMSETCPILTLAHLRPHMSEWDVERRLPFLCRAGRPLPFVQLRIVDAQMNDVAHDGVSQGEVVVRSPWLTQGYLGEPERSEELWRGGWLHTGDVGVIDADGYLKVVDRIKDVVKTGGEWVSSLEVEDIISQHPDVSEVAVIGVKDDKWGERPKALVVLKTGRDGTLAADDLKAFVKTYAERGIISKFGVPQDIVFVESLLKTSVGKLNKKALREFYEDV